MHTCPRAECFGARTPHRPGTNLKTDLHMSWKKSATHSTPFKVGQHEVFVFDGKLNHNLPDLGPIISMRLSLQGDLPIAHSIG